MAVIMGVQASDRSAGAAGRGDGYNAVSGPLETAARNPAAVAANRVPCIVVLQVAP
jgi:hypothetical protein